MTNLSRLQLWILNNFSPKTSLTGKLAQGESQHKFTIKNFQGDKFSA